MTTKREILRTDRPRFDQDFATLSFSVQSRYNTFPPESGVRAIFPASGNSFLKDKSR